MLKFFVALMILFVPLNVAAQSKDLWIDGARGKLFATLQTPDGQAKFPLMILCHGFNADKDYPLLKTLADTLEASGIASIRFDFNGHGQSDGDFQGMTIANEIADAKKVFDFARKLDGVTSISIAGHSQGGVVASTVAGELGAQKIKTIVLFAASPAIRDNALIGNLFHVRFDPLDPPEYIEINTPYGKRKVGREYILTAQNLPIYETAAKFTGNALMIHGTGDRRVAYTYSLRYKKVFRRGEIKIFDRADHAFTGEENRVAKFVADWLTHQIK